MPVFVLCILCIINMSAFGNTATISIETDNQTYEVNMESLISWGNNCDDLLEQIPNIDEVLAQDKEGTLLTLALYDNPDVIDCLIQHGADPNILFTKNEYSGIMEYDYMESTIADCENNSLPEEIAAHKDQICPALNKSMQILAQQGYLNQRKENKRKQDTNKIEYSCNNTKYRTPVDIFVAVKCGNLKNLEAILRSIHNKKVKHYAITYKHYGFPAIFYSISKANNNVFTKITNVLIQNGAIKDEPEKSLALLAATMSLPPHRDIIQMLLDPNRNYNINVNYALMMASKLGLISSIKTLLEYGADVNFNYFKQTPLGLAIRFGNDTTADYLFNKGTSLETIKTVLSLHKRQGSSFCCAGSTCPDPVREACTDLILSLKFCGNPTIDCEKKQ